MLAALLLPVGSAASGWCGGAAQASSANLRGKKVFYLDSYDATFQPSILTKKGTRDVFGPAGVQMEVFYLDEKNNPREEALRGAALTARQRIDAWKPDLIIASDDPASKYVIVPWYRRGICRSSSTG